MSMEVENRVSKLEQVLERFIVNTEKSISNLTEERRKDKEEFKQYRKANRIAMEKYKEENKEEFKQYREENRIALEKYKEENKEEFKQYRKENRIALEKYKEENRVALENYKKENKEEFKEYTKKTNKDWGDLANKMGTLIEDIFMPGVGPSVRRYFNSDIDFIGTHVKKQIKKLELKGEFDVVATDEERVYVVDVKSTSDKQKIDNFKDDVLPRFRRLFPEYHSKKLIPIIGSLRFDADVISYASEQGIYVLGYREWEYLDILNFDEVKPRQVSE